MPGGEPGTALREDGDRFSGVCSVRVTPLQRYTTHVKDWHFPIVEKPGKGEYRYVRFAWKKIGGAGIMIQLHANDGSQWNHRYLAGSPTVPWPALPVTDKAPAGWEVVTRDLFRDFGAFTLTGIALTPMDGTAGLFDHVYLGQTVEDLDRVTAACLGQGPPRNALPRTELERFWLDLGSRDALVAAPAVRAMIAGPKESVPFLEERLLARSAGADQKRVRRLIEELDADTFKARENASQELGRLGKEAVPLLKQALRDTSSPEVRVRIGRLLEGQKLRGGELSAEQRVVLRSVRVLEQVGTPEARRLLEMLAEEDLPPALIAEVKSALGRLARPTAGQP
jgi:hypothetical protein